MDSTRLAALCRALGAGTTRRAVAAALAGVLGLEVAFTAADEGAAGGKLGARRGRHQRGRTTNKRRARRKQRGKDKGHTPGDTRACRAAEDCGALGSTCCGGQCCPAGHTCCGDTVCQDLRSDVKNCGRCGEVCPGDALTRHLCVEGQCVPCIPGIHPNLSEHLARAAPGDTLYLCGPQTYSGPFTIAKPVTLQGVGDPATIVLQVQVRGLTKPTVKVEANDVTLRNLTISSGASGEDTGGVVNTGRRLLLEHVRLIDHNAAHLPGGGLTNSGPVASATLDACLVARNTGGTGGGLYNGNAQGQMTLRNGTIVEGNTALESGGGIFNRGILRIENSRVQGNSAPAGGGLQNEGGTMTLANQTIVQKNTATGAVGIGAGGGVNNASGAVVFEGEAFVIDNKAQGGAGSGGGIFNHGTVASLNRLVSTLVVNNTPDDCINNGGGTGCPG